MAGAQRWRPGTPDTARIQTTRIAATTSIRARFHLGGRGACSREQTGPAQPLAAGGGGTDTARPFTGCRDGPSVGNMVRQARHSGAADGGPGHRLSGLLLPLQEETNPDDPADPEIPAVEPPAGASSAAGRLRWKVGSNAVLIILAMLASAVLIVVIHAMSQQLANENVAAAPSQQVRVPINGSTGVSGAAAGGSAAETRDSPPPARSQPETAVPNRGSPGPSDLTRGNSGSAVLVHVAGAVVHPGVVELPSGSRVYQAIAAAGGELPEAAVDAVNLAAVLQDGEQLFIRTKDQAAAAPGPGAQGGAAGAAGAPPGGAALGSAAGTIVNLNTAGLEELMTLPKVGPVLAQRILDFRRQHGTFATAQELDAVDGIGPKLLASLLPLLTV